MGIQFELIDIDTDTEWNDFVKSHPSGKIYHHTFWGRVLYQSFGYQPFYFMIADPSSHQILGIFPSMIQKSLFRKDRIISLPLTGYCPCLIQKEHFNNCIEYLHRFQNHKSAIELKCDRQMTELDEQYSETCHYINHTIKLNVDKETFYRSILNKSCRRKIKKATEKEMQFKLADSMDGVHAFYSLFASSRKKKGLPILPFAFFENMWKILSPEKMMMVPVIEYQGKIIAADILLNYKDTLYSEYSASDTRYFPYGVNQKMLWELVCFGLREKKNFIDLGRSRLSNTSLIEFKKKWNTRADYLYYYYHPDQSREKIRHSRSLYNFALWIHKRFPVKLLEFEGKFIYRYFG